MFRGIVEAGAVPAGVECGLECGDGAPDGTAGGPGFAAMAAGVLATADGLVLTGGADIDPRLTGGDPADPLVAGVNRVRDHNELTILDMALDAGIPVLAICRGAQLVNARLGGITVADLPRDRPGPVRHRYGEVELAGATHAVTVAEGTLLASLLGRSGVIGVNSEHHQGMGALASGLRVAATADDGLIEAFESDDGAVVAVQWHPEVLWPAESHALALLRGFARFAAARTRGR
jgi:putative glutamine amidotransferase